LEKKKEIFEGAKRKPGESHRRLYLPHSWRIKGSLASGSTAVAEVHKKRTKKDIWRQAALYVV
jgi:hypothetical protein